MSTAIAIVLVGVPYVAAGAIVLLARGHTWLVRPLTVVALLSFAALGIYHTGGFRAADPAWVKDRALGSAGGVAGRRCEELLQVLRDNGIVSDLPSRKDAVAVSAETWRQLPSQAREIAERCLAEQKGVQPDALRIVEMDNAKQ